MKNRLKLTPSVLALLSMASLDSMAALGVQIEDLRLGRHDDKTRVVFDLSGPVAYSVTTQDSPPALIIELPNTDTEKPLPLALAATPIAGVDIEGDANTGLRVKFSLKHTVETASFLMGPHLSRGDRLVVDFYAASPHHADNTEVPDSDPAPNSDQSTSDSASTTAPTDAPPEGPSKNIAQQTERAATDMPALMPVPRAQEQQLQEHQDLSPQFTFSGTWEQEWAYQTNGAGNQKFEALLEPRLDVSFSSGAQLVAIARVRLDAVGDLGPSGYRPDNYSEANGPSYNTEHVELSLRELYLDAQWAGAYWRLGKQQVVWGQADGIKVLDVVNPQSFREFILDDFDDSRIPLWMVNAEIPLGKNSLQVLWIPDTSYSELAEAGTPYFLNSPKWVPTVPPATGIEVSALDKPNNALKDSDFGLRYSAFLAGWDVTLNYLYHYQDYPVLYQQLTERDTFDVLQITPTYERNHLVGGTLSNAFNDFTFRAELAYSTDTYHSNCSLGQNGICESPELASVLALDWQYSGNGLLSAQWFQSYLTDYSREMVRDETENNISLLYQQDFANASWQLRVLGLYSLNDKDSMLQFKLNYWLLGNLEVWLGADVFNGDRAGTFGQFDTQDRVLLGLEYGF